MFDGSLSSAGVITHYLDVGVQAHADSSPISSRLNVTKLHGADVVLGSNWMTRHGVSLDLAKRTITLDAPSRLSSTVPASDHAVLQATSSRRGSPCTYPNNIMLPIQGKWASSPSRDSSLPGAQSDGEVPLVSSPLDAQSNNEASSESCSTANESLDTTPHDLDGYGATDSPVFAEDRQHETLQAVVMGSYDEDPSTLYELQSLEPQFYEPVDDSELEKETEELLKLVPSHYHDYLDIFRKKAGTETLPPTREYDMRIELKPSAKLAVAKLYQLTEDQRLVLRDVLDRETKAGRIRPSNSPYGSPTFFTLKKDGTWRMVVDYRRLNEATIPDVYPLPLISQLTNELSKAKFFSKFDLVGAYQLLRVLEPFVPLTAFRTQYGMYESLVMRDGLRNAPAVFQHFLNEVFKKFLGRGVVVYIDDLLLYAENLDELRRLTHEVFKLTRGASLYMKAKKCQFETTSITFLGFVISENGIQTDPEKVKAVQEFPQPRDLRESRSFIGLVSYYRRFVPNFSKIAAPITSLTRKDVPFEWGTAQQDAFQALKDMLASAPVLAHYDPTRETILQTDASHFGWGFVISQINAETGLEHPVAIESGRFTGAQLNYSTSEKEFLAIVEAFVRNRHMLLQVDTLVVTDHNNLRYWMEPRQLSPRQARWREILAPFRFKIVYRPGKEATMPDALSRRADYHPGKGSTVDQEHNFVQALPCFEEEPGASATVGEKSPHFSLRALQPLVSVFDREYFVDDADLTQGLHDDAEIRPVRDQMLQVRCWDCQHPTCRESQVEPASLSEIRRTSRNQTLNSPAWTKRGFISLNGRVYVPNRNDARLKILQARHDSPLAGHPGILKTIELVSRDYTWIGLKRDVEAYVTGCAVCQRTKPNHQAPSGLLRTLQIPSRPWSSISMDFIEELPSSHGYNSILVVVDRLTKWAVFVPTTTRLTSPGLAELILQHIVSQHGLPHDIVSDRGSKFVSKFWRHLTELLGIKLNLSTAYHPQTDGQTERVNQVLEQYLRVFTSYNQDDWSTLLGQASFAYNNSVHKATKVSPFYANFGYHPRWVDEISPGQASDVPEATNVAASVTDVHRQCAANIAEANRSYAKAYDAKRRPPPEYEIGDEVLLSLENVRTLRPSKKLDIRHAGPYAVVAKVGSHAYRLRLPETVRIHDVFHVSLLRPYRAPTYPGQASQAPGPVEIDSDGHAQYEVANILNSRNEPRSGRLQYLIEWLGYEGTDEHTSWEPKDNVVSAMEKIEEFHLRYPEKPATDIVLRRRRKANRV